MTSSPGSAAAGRRSRRSRRRASALGHLVHRGGGEDEQAEAAQQDQERQREEARHAGDERRRGQEAEPAAAGTHRRGALGRRAGCRRATWTTPQAPSSSAAQPMALRPAGALCSGWRRIRQAAAAQEQRGGPGQPAHDVRRPRRRRPTSPGRRGATRRPRRPAARQPIDEQADAVAAVRRVEVAGAVPDPADRRRPRGARARARGPAGRGRALDEQGQRSRAAVAGGRRATPWRCAACGLAFGGRARPAARRAPRRRRWPDAGARTTLSARSGPRGRGGPAGRAGGRAAGHPPEAIRSSHPSQGSQPPHVSPQRGQFVRHRARANYRRCGRRLRPRRRPG